MKKLIFILFAFLAISTATAQPTSNFKTIKLTAPPTGGSNDDILTIGADKVVKKVAKSSLATDISGKENTIDPGTTSQYLRGDKTWAEFPSPNVEPLEFNLTNRTVWNNGKGNLPSNTSFGEYALPQVTTGGNNTGLGRSALNSVTEGYNNVGIGSLVLDHIITGSNNIGIGVAVGYSMSGDNSRNIGIGTSALGSTFRTGNDNIGLGNLAGAYSSIGEYNGNSSIYIGNSTQPLGTDQTNQIVIGHEAIGAGSNTVTLGNTSIVKTVLRGTINTTSMPVYADNAAATAGGLLVGDQYRTSTGVVMVRY